jgi:5-methylcytosine-specific restriction endonuclease McrA
MMPMKPKTFSAINRKARYESSPERILEREFYKSRQWRSLRKWYLAEQPLCECGCHLPAEQVHHKIEVKKRPDLALDPTNLQSLTRACHSRITRERQINATRKP